MAVNYVKGSEDSFDIIEISAVQGINTRKKALGREPDEFTSLQNARLFGEAGLEKRLGIAKKGTAQTGDKVVGLGYHEDDTGITPLCTVNQTLYKFTGGAWTASDKVNYTADLDTVIVPFTSKSGSALDSGTSTSESTAYKIVDNTKSWTPGEWSDLGSTSGRGYCVVCEGEVKHINNNDETTLYFDEKFDSDEDGDYQSKTYEIYDLAPYSIIINGTDDIQKYDLTTTTAIDGNHVPNGKALPKATVGAVYSGRLWMANGNGDTNDRVWYSDNAVAENVSLDTNMNINLSFFNDGDAVQNLGPISLEESSVMIVAKEKSVHAIEGETVLNFTSRPVIERDGCIARKSFAADQGICFMLGNKGVLSVADSVMPKLSDPIPISQPIQEDIDAESLADRQDACGIIFDNKYYLRIGTNIWYYDIEESLRQQKHVWVDALYGFYDFHRFAVIDGTLYAGDASSGQVLELNSGNDDDGADIDLIVESAEISVPGRPNIWVDRVEIMAEKETSTVLYFQYKTDGGSYGTLQTATLDENNGRYVFNVRERCKSIQFKIIENGSNTPARIIYPLRVFYSRSEFGEDGTKVGSL